MLAPHLLVNAGADFPKQSKILNDMVRSCLSFCWATLIGVDKNVQYRTKY